MTEEREKERGAWACLARMGQEGGGGCGVGTRAQAGERKHWARCPGVFGEAGQERHGQRWRHVPASALSESRETEGFHSGPCDTRGREFTEGF